MWSDFVIEQKTAPSFHHYKKSMMNMTNTYEDESMNNLTLGLNESKQSIGATKMVNILHYTKSNYE